MSRQLNRVQQGYGYIVCLIAIIAGLIAGKATLDAAFDLSRPSEAGAYGSNPAMASFEAYKLERQTRATPPGAQPVTLPPDSTLRRLYTEERESERRYAHWQATKSLVTDGMVLIVAVLLFVTHWRWRRNPAGETGVISVVTRE